MLSASCGDDGPGTITAADGGGTGGDAGGDAQASAATAPNYWAHVAPIMFSKCVSCHQAGGIAPFALDSYERAKQWGPAAGLAITRGDMPPYYMIHDGSCGDFEASAA